MTIPPRYAGVISGTDGGLIKEGEGIFTLGSATGGQSDYTGNTEVKGGTLALGRDNAISGSGTLRVDNGSTFDLGALSPILSEKASNWFTASLTPRARVRPAIRMKASWS